VPAELERKFKQTDPILRFMTVRKSPGELKQGKKKEKTLEPAPAPAPAAPEQNDEEGK